MNYPEPTPARAVVVCYCGTRNEVALAPLGGTRLHCILCQRMILSGYTSSSYGDYVQCGEGCVFEGTGQRMEKV